MKQLIFEQVCLRRFALEWGRFWWLPEHHWWNCVIWVQFGKGSRTAGSFTPQIGWHPLLSQYGIDKGIWIFCRQESPYVLYFALLCYPSIIQVDSVKHSCWPSSSSYSKVATITTNTNWTKKTLNNPKLYLQTNCFVCYSISYVEPCPINTTAGNTGDAPDQSGSAKWIPTSLSCGSVLQSETEHLWYRNTQLGLCSSLGVWIRGREW
jgi:hypothetical protein